MLKYLKREDMNIKDFIKHKDNIYNLENNNLELNKETLDYLIKNSIHFKIFR